MRTWSTTSRGFGAGVIALLCLRCSDASSADKSRSVANISDALACAECRIREQPIATLEVPPDTTDGFPIAVRMDSLGRFWVFRRGDVPALFDPHGRFVQLLGRSGRGPGEYENAYDLLEPNRDTLLVLDLNRRGTYLDTTLRPLGYTRLPMELHSPTIVRWPDTVIATGNVAYRGSDGPLYHLAFSDEEAVIVRQIKPRDEDIPEMIVLAWHELTTPRHGRFWSVWSHRYDLTQLGGDGKRLRALQRRPEWFAGQSGANWDWKNEPPPPYVVDIEEDDAGLLWVFTHVASGSWREAWPELPGNVEVPARMIDEGKLYRTVVEVIDPRHARVVTRTTLEHYTVGCLPGRLVALYEEDESGARILVRKLELLQK